MGKGIQKNGPSKICGIYGQPLKNFTWSILNTLTHMLSYGAGEVNVFTFTCIATLLEKLYLIASYWKNNL